MGHFASRQKGVPYLLSVSQMPLVSLVTHLTDGHMETHFAYFGSLALLTSFREWRFLILASAVAAADHLLRGIFMPYSIFGMHHVEIWRIAEHALWVVWEHIFLLRICIQGLNHLRHKSMQSAQQKLTPAWHKLLSCYLLPRRSTNSAVCSAAARSNSCPKQAVLSVKLEPFLNSWCMPQGK
jgi:hypothetical protein